jgi:hypothetical protein
MTGPRLYTSFGGAEASEGLVMSPFLSRGANTAER